LKSWAVYKAAKSGSDTPIIENEMAPPASGIEAQRALMANFSARGLENPAKSVTKKGFREKWVMGIIEDDLPYSLGEKVGMKKVLAYILPRSLSAPSHQTVRRDLDILYQRLDDKVNKELQVGSQLPYSRSYSETDFN
jgi:hypothetical protein